MQVTVHISCCILSAFFKESYSVETKSFPLIFLNIVSNTLIFPIISKSKSVKEAKFQFIRNQRMYDMFMSTQH